MASGTGTVEWVADCGGMGGWMDTIYRVRTLRIWENGGYNGMDTIELTPVRWSWPNTALVRHFPHMEPTFLHQCMSIAFTSWHAFSFVLPNSIGPNRHSRTNWFSDHMCCEISGYRIFTGFSLVKYTRTIYFAANATISSSIFLTSVEIQKIITLFK